MRYLIITFFSLFTFLSISAQKLTVESFVQTTDAIARTRNVKGTDGNVCAAVVVRIPTKEATFDGGFIIGKPTYKSGEYILDMQTGAAQMRVSVPGYNTIDVKFRDYLDGSALQSKTTYLLTINVPQTAKMQTLNIKVTPSDAIVLVDGKIVEETTTSISVGSHRYNVTAKGYYPQEGTIEVREDTPAKILAELDRKETTVQHNNTVQTLTVSSATNVAQSTGTIINVSNGHEYVDLGLSVKWATCNIGASSPEEYGEYYAWGETETKSVYDWRTYKWCKRSSKVMTKYCTQSSYGIFDDKTLLDLEDDVAHVKWGGSWRMPTFEELTELQAKCTWIWTTKNGVNGYKVTSKKNGKSIFIPAAGNYYGSSLDDVESYGYYWTSSQNSSNSYDAYNLYLDSDDVDSDDSSRYYGFTVRAVCP